MSFSRIAAIVAVLFFSKNAISWCPEPKDDLRTEFQNSDCVFVGKVLSERSIEGEATNLFIYCIKLERVFRGDPDQKEIEVWTENSSGRYPLTVGRGYLLFSSAIEKRAYIPSAKAGDKFLGIDGCGHNSEIGQAGEVVRELEAFGKLKNELSQEQMHYLDTRGIKIPEKSTLVGDKKILEKNKLPFIGEWLAVSKKQSLQKVILRRDGEIRRFWGEDEIGDQFYSWSYDELDPGVIKMEGEDGDLDKFYYRYDLENDGISFKEDDKKSYWLRFTRRKEEPD